MKKQWMIQGITAFFAGLILFMLMSVIYKLIRHREDWLLLSLTWSISWAVGHFISGIITNLCESISRALFADLVITLLVFIVLAFVMGIVCSVTNWLNICLDMTVAFGASMIINNKWNRSKT